MKFRSFVLILASIVTVLLLVAAAIAFWLASQSPLAVLRGGTVAAPAAAMFVSRQAPLMTSLLVNPDRLEALRLALAPTNQRRQARTEFAQLKQTLLGDRGLNYETDIQPWLGDEITWAVTTPDIDRDETNGRQPGYLLAVATRNPEQAREFLQLFWQKRAIAGNDLVFEQYAGVKIIYGNAPPRASAPTDAPATALASAVVGDRFVLFANAPKVLREAINNVQTTDLSLSNSPSYQAALAELPDRQIGLTFVNLPQFARWVGQGEPTGDQPPFDSLVMGWQLKRQGILADATLLTAAGHTLQPTQPSQTNPVAALQYIPSGALVSASGTDLKHLWSELEDSLSGYGTLSALLNQPLQTLEQRWQVKFSEDLVNWVEGEFALALVPNPNTQQSDWVFVAEKSAATPAALANLDAIAQKQGLSIGPVTLGEQQAFAWTKLSTRAPSRRDRKQKTATTLQAQVQAVHTTVGNYELFARSVEALDLALKAQEEPLVNTPDFQQAIAPLNKNNDGYLYLDWRSVWPTLEAKLPVLRLLELTAKPLFDHGRSLTITSYGSTTNLRRGAIFLRLQN